MSSSTTKPSVFQIAVRGNQITTNRIHVATDHKMRRPRMSWLLYFYRQKTSMHFLKFDRSRV